MTRAELEHIIRAAAQIADDMDIVVVGSQAVLGEHPDAPHAMLVSMEADVYPRSHPERADLIDGAMGEGSLFRETFGYYAQGVGPETPAAPAGWQERLIQLRNENTGGASGWCLETHDLVLAKCVAGREKDWEFADHAVGAELVDLATLLARAAELPLDPSAVYGLVGLLRSRYRGQ